MKNKKKFPLLTVSLLGSALCFNGCSQNEDPTVAESADNRSSEIIRLAESPASAITVAQARQEAQPGQQVTVVGQVGGVRAPIATDYASFVIADQAVYFCDEMQDEGCATPWDACCEDPDKLASLRASVVFVDDKGQPRLVDLRQQTGLSELNLVTVKGVVAPESTPQNLIIHASGFYNASL